MQLILRQLLVGGEAISFYHVSGLFNLHIAIRVKTMLQHIPEHFVRTKSRLRGPIVDKNVAFEVP